MASLVITFFTRLWRYSLLTALTYIGILNFLLQSCLISVYFVSPTLYRKLTTFQLRISVPGFLCVPFSWANCQLYSNGLYSLQCRTGHDQLILTNHLGRVDWLFGLYIGNFFKQRIGFITEAFLMWLPFVGWQRYLVEDMFVFRSFKRDKERLLKNIQDFKDSGVRRWVYLCPEGHIADFNATDKQYIQDCGEFCKANDLEPFKMLLTPRYKGMQIFTNLCPKDSNDESVVKQGTLTYVQNGVRLIRPLRNNDRVIPDLWNAVSGGIQCYVHCHSFVLSEDPQAMKKQLMYDYAMQDKSLYEFYKTGRYPVAHPEMTLEDSPEYWRPIPFPNLPFLSQAEMDRRTGADPSKLPPRKVDSDYQELPKNHLEMNLSFFGQIFASFWILVQLEATAFIVPMLTVLYCALAFSHLLGEFLANGQSRESLPFEGAFKALMFRFYGVEGGDESKPVEKQTERPK